MAGYKETPRQKMIAMMYLVLTALLALNVSKDIINAFVIVNDSLIQTDKNYVKKLGSSYSSFEAQYALKPIKVKPYIDKAKQVQKLSNDLVTYITNIEYEVIAKTEGGGMTPEIAKKTHLGDISAKDNFDIPTHYFMGESEDGSKGKARELKNKINDYKQQVSKILGRDTADIKFGLNTKDSRNKLEGRTCSWEFNNFSHTILAGSVTILNKLIVDIHNAESDVVTHLYKSITAEDFKFDQIGAKVIARSNIVWQGDKYDADIIVAAYDTKQNPEIFIKTGVDTIINFDPATCLRIEGSRGVGKLTFPASALGPQKFAGVIRIISPSGEKKSYYFNQEYTVEKPSATVSADAMNVFYISVDNPVSISAAGVSMENLKPTITAGTLTPQGGGKYVVRVSPGTKSTRINVNADINGALKPMGSFDFRVRMVPDPVAYIANVKGGYISKENLIAAGAIIPQMENFEFNLFFKVTEFSLSTAISGDIITEKTVGNLLNDKMKRILKSLRRGQKVYIEDIKAKGPDGSTRNLASINLTIN